VPILIIFATPLMLTLSMHHSLAPKCDRKTFEEFLVPKLKNAVALASRLACLLRSYSPPAVVVFHEEKLFDINIRHEIDLEGEGNTIGLNLENENDVARERNSIVYGQGNNRFHVSEPKEDGQYQILFCIWPAFILNRENPVVLKDAEVILQEIPYEPQQ